MLPKFASLSEIASWLYESAYFIGNNSGIGHLASCLGVPTLSITARYGDARLWRPSWGQNEIIYLPPWIISRKLKEKLWQKLISVKMVLKKFQQLQTKSL